MYGNTTEVSGMRKLKQHSPHPEKPALTKLLSEYRWNCKSMENSTTSLWWSLHSPLIMI
jgi:hypothetical protein